MKVSKHLTAAMILFAGIVPSLAGTWTLDTDPQPVIDSAGISYVPVNKTYANSPGVTFTLNAMATNGTVTDWHWDFINGTPPESTAESPTESYGTSAYGKKNAFTFTFDHFGSGGTGALCSSPKVTGYVNVVKPFLEFNTGEWSSNDPLQSSSFVANAHFATSGPTFNQGQSCMRGSGLTGGGVPYEYKVTANPSNSGAPANPSPPGAESTAFAINELNSWVVAVYSEPNTTAIFTTRYSLTPSVPPYVESDGTGAYVPGDSYNDTVGLDEGSTPTNPVVYAFDYPGVPDVAAIYDMSGRGVVGNKVVYTITLTSTPCYQESPINLPDTTLNESNIFVLTARTAGDGKVNWSSN